jgi:mRNA interferase YafQ
MDGLISVLNILPKNESLPEKNKDHQLKGKLSKFRECHIKSNILLIYKRNDTLETITLSRFGSHQQIRLTS